MTSEHAYDPWGRLKYDPELHPRQGLPWTNEDEKYLIERYELDGALEVSFALGRTLTTVQTRVYELRKAGKMPPPRADRKNFRRDLRTKPGRKPK